MRIQNLKSPNFCARAEYRNCFHNSLGLEEWRKEPQLSIDARGIIAGIEDLPAGYYFEILREGCDNRMHANASPNSLEVLSIGIRNNKGRIVIPYKEIFHKRDIERSALLGAIPEGSDHAEFHHGELDSNDLSGSLRKLAQDMKREFEIKLIKVRLRKGMNGKGKDQQKLLEALSILADSLGYKLIKKV